MTGPVQLDLVEFLGGPALTPEQRCQITRHTPKPKGYAKPPGSGPAGETCKGCKHYRVVESRARKTFRKCGRLESHWTHGPGTDILAKSAACSLWEKPA